MNIYLISEYVKRLTKDDIIKFSLNQGVNLDEQELDIIYNHLKNDYKTFIYGNPRPILDQIKKEVKPITYNKIENLYQQFKDYLQ